MNIEYFTQASLAIQIHILVAVGAFFLAGFLLMRRKGTRSHKMAGRIFAGLMIATATTAIFIRELNDGSFSWIHLFVPLTFVTMWQAITAIRAGNVRAHKRHVLGLCLGALLIPGIFSFLPGRTMWMLFFA